MFKSKHFTQERNRESKLPQDKVEQNVSPCEPILK